MAQAGDGQRASEPVTMRSMPTGSCYADGTYQRRQGHAAMPALAASRPSASSAARNRLLPADRAVHDWYRFVLSFPPHLVRDYACRFGLAAGRGEPEGVVLDPFCGTGTTLVECKKLGLASVGMESNPMAHFASAVKVDWAVDGGALRRYAHDVAGAAARTLACQGIRDCAGAPLLAADSPAPAAGSATPLRGLPAEQARLLLTNSISPLPLHRTLVLLDAIDDNGSEPLRRSGRLALANALVRHVGNLKFGPEVGVGKAKSDAPVLDVWLQGMNAMARDVDALRDRTDVPAQAMLADSRDTGALEPQSVAAVITSPPYPNEKDYTRTTRLESVILGLVRDRAHLRQLKQTLVRSNTRSVYKADTDDREVADHASIAKIADAIEQRRQALGKTSGFERLYHRVTRLYFGGMRRHLASLRPALKPGAKLAYVVGDQASYLRVMIRTGELIAEVAQSLGYKVVTIDLFRTRPSTATGDQLREEVVVLEWPGGR